ncbi:hypothetical protein [Flavobacterium sp. H122]|uniref:hypothetical protein n=1 Tax=Flavobacterium sp. H122 TaxID=2529860 RepID=UPI0010AA1AF5|nr:hypothetical protein [Flavobacterium sp. H122]
MEAYIQMLKEQNPEMAKYFELMQPMMQKNDSEESQDSEIMLELEEKIKKLKGVNQKLFTIVEGLQSQLKFEISQNDNLAKAIGACTECFGENKNCPECFGNGKPGSNVPDFILFNKYVSPAIQKYNKHFFNKN